MKAITQLALNAITSLRKFWAKSDPVLALTELQRIRDAANEAIDEVDHGLQQRNAANGVFAPDYIERLR
ncbi:MAG: hypothetical protein KF821_01750 [Anaerolineales bacterium]|nr:hypothetical protein [Anaerolineales bacterium]